jgi:hypothetical protein
MRSHAHQPARLCDRQRPTPWREAGFRPLIGANCRQRLSPHGTDAILANHRRGAGRNTRRTLRLRRSSLRQGRARPGPGVDSGGPVGPAAAAHGIGEPHRAQDPERLRSPHPRLGERSVRRVVGQSCSQAKNRTTRPQPAAAPARLPFVVHTTGPRDGGRQPCGFRPRLHCPGSRRVRPSAHS